MRIQELIVPQLGEGLQEARIIEFFKQPGEQVLRDEPLYQIETDKAGMDIESPLTGILQAWLANEGDLVPVGSPIARIETPEGVKHLTEHSEVPAPSLPRLPNQSAERKQEGHTPSEEVDRRAKKTSRLIIPPRTRAYCRTLGISAEQMRQISAKNGKKLMPADVERYLAQQTVQTEPVGYQERLLTSQQRTLIHRLKRSTQVVVPASLTYQLDWNQLRQAKQVLRHSLSEFETLAYLVAQASTSHPLFRSTLSDDKIRQYDHLNLGVAVHRPNDDLVTAVIPKADTLELPSFVSMTRQQVERALLGEDQVSQSTQVLLTYMVDYGVIAATPVLVAPAIAVLFVGAPYPQGDTLKANLTITFDHRLINGVAAAKFAEAIALSLQNLASLPEESVQTRRHEDVQPAPYARPDERYQLLKQQVMAEVAPFLSQQVTQVADEVSWRELGFNSRLSVELANALTTRFGLSFSPTLLWNYPTIKSLLSHLADKLEIPREMSANDKQITAKESPSADSKVEAIYALSEDEAELLLAKKLDFLSKKGK